MPKTMAVFVIGMMMLSYLAIPVETGGEEDDGLAEWTFIVYLCADNNLEGAGMNDMNEMEIAGSTDNVNIIALVDRASLEDVGSGDYAGEGDWEGFRIYHIQQDNDMGKLGEYEEGVNVWFSEMEPEMEPNMGDPEFLIEYVKWAMERFPAKRYMLDFWNHGGAFWGICWDDSHGDHGDALDMTELSYGLEEITRHLGRKIDIIGFDACLMAQTAVLYQIKDYCDIAVASGFVEPGDGWPYERILPPLVSSPEMEPAELAITIVDEYITSYTNNEDDPSDAYMVSMSAFDMDAFENAAESINRFGMALALGPTEPQTSRYYSRLRTIRSRTASYDMVNLGPFDFTQYCMYDVWDFADKVERDPLLNRLNAHLAKASQDVKMAVDDCIIKSELHDVARNHQGLTAYFPGGGPTGQTTYDPRFSETKYAKDKYWDEWLNLFGADEVVDSTPPSVVIYSPSGSHTFKLEETITIVGTAFDMQESIKYVEVKIGEDGDWVQAEGAEEWSYSFEANRHLGDLKIYARSYDGNEYSPEVARVVYVREVASMPVSAAQEGEFPWAVVIVPLLALIAVAAIRKNKMRVQ